MIGRWVLKIIRVAKLKQTLSLYTTVSCSFHSNISVRPCCVLHRLEVVMPRIEACCVHWFSQFWINTLVIKSWKFYAAKKAAVTRPGAHVNKATPRSRWLPAAWGSWICPPVLNPPQVDNDGDDDGVYDRQPHLDSLVREQKPTGQNQILHHVNSLKDTGHESQWTAKATSSLSLIAVWIFIQL